MVVTISLSEYDNHRVKVGMPCTITTAYGKYEGEVTAKALPPPADLPAPSWTM